VIAFSAGGGCNFLPDQYNLKQNKEGGEDEEQMARRGEAGGGNAHTNAPDFFMLSVAYAQGDVSPPAPASSGDDLFSSQESIIQSNGTFSDVPSTYWAFIWVEALSANGITGGCATVPTSLFCPENPVTRAQMAVFLERGMQGSAYIPSVATGAVFSDVPASHWAADWIEQLADDGITAGCGAGNFCPGNIVTRAQMAVFLLHAKYGAAYAPPPASGTIFNDVPGAHWAADWIEQLAAEGITTGCGNGNYCPGSKVTRAQMAVFLGKTFFLTGRAENLSTNTTCAEEDNVNVPIFAESFDSFGIQATHTTYEFEVDNCNADFSGCALTPNIEASEIDDICDSLYNDGDTIVNGCTVSEWWRPYTTQIEVMNGGSGAYHYLVIYKKITGENSWPQFLVLYEDGYLRLKPHPGPGQSDVCFGSSVIVGPVTDHASLRPYVDISTIEVDPTNLELNITYLGGGNSQISLAVDRTQASATILANYSHDDSNPLVVFRSMFVEDGNADVDHIRNSAGNQPIGDAWTPLVGPYWEFIRETVSSHNTSAPDFRIEMLVQE